MYKKQTIKNLGLPTKVSAYALLYHSNFLLVIYYTINSTLYVCLCMFNENVSQKFLDSTRLDLRKIGTKETCV